jgi:type I restriction enzyme R subunit
MATGTGKTLTSCAIIKMFLRLYKVNRVLFLVDRLELESQAQKEFDQVLKNDFKTVIWKENQGDWKKAEIVVSTVQSFISKNKYKRIFDHDDFDLVISDQAHRSLGARGRRVFEYFNGFKLGLTATPKDFLKSVYIEKMGEKDPRQLEKRFMMDTYTTFGCETGEPTFRFSLEDGVKKGFLVNPQVLDARTQITTQLLSDEGYHFEGVDEEKAISIRSQFIVIYRSGPREGRRSKFILVNSSKQSSVIEGFSSIPAESPLGVNLLDATEGQIVSFEITQ